MDIKEIENHLKILIKKWKISEEELFVPLAHSVLAKANDFKEFEKNWEPFYPTSPHFLYVAAVFYVIKEKGGKGINPEEAEKDKSFLADEISRSSIFKSMQQIWTVLFEDEE